MGRRTELLIRPRAGDRRVGGGALNDGLDPASAQSPADESQVVRLESMLHNLDVFWTSVRKALPQLEAGSELELKTTRVAIVESGPDQLVVKAAGQLREFTIETMPTSVVVAIAEQRIVNDANWKMLRGTFLAVDPKGDRARQLWREAAQEGIDLDDLMPELEGAPAG